MYFITFSSTDPGFEVTSALYTPFVMDLFSNWLSLLGSFKFWVLGSSFQPGSFYCWHLYVKQCCESCSKIL